jgi:hypothetical protein
MRPDLTISSDQSQGQTLGIAALMQSARNCAWDWLPSLRLGRVGDGVDTLGLEAPDDPRSFGEGQNADFQQQSTK